MHASKLLHCNCKALHNDGTKQERNDRVINRVEWSSVLLSSVACCIHYSGWMVRAAVPSMQVLNECLWKRECYWDEGGNAVSSLLPAPRSAAEGRGELGFYSSLLMGLYVGIRANTQYVGAYRNPLVPTFHQLN